MPIRFTIAIAAAILTTPLAGAAPDTAAAKAEFAAAFKELRDLVAELSTLQADYQKPNADKTALETRYKAAVTKAQAANERVERTAFAAIAADPKDEAALDVCGSMLAAAVQQDDPTFVLAHAEELDAAGVKNADFAMMAADAAMKLSRLDAAEAWLKKAEAAGVDKQKLTALAGAIEHDRSKVEKEMALREAEAKADDLPRVKITTSKGDIVVELFENEAPNTVANFIELVEKGFYDGTPFHRVIGGFMAQGGDPTGTGTGGPGHAIACECDAPNAREHFLGTLSMAHAGKNTGGSQFFLTFVPTEHLDGKHTVFGRVIEGFDVLPKITRTEGEAAGTGRDTIVRAAVVRKRNHPYEAKKLPNPRG
jgi:cyclophilin family peptidyl-prolyl cis-trans isomerase